MRGGGAGGAGGAGGHLPADGGAAQPRGTRAQSVGMRLRALTARGVSAEWWHPEPPGLPPPPPGPDWDPRPGGERTPELRAGGRGGLETGRLDRHLRAALSQLRAGAPGGAGGHPLTFPGLSWTAAFPPALCLLGRPALPSCVPPGAGGGGGIRVGTPQGRRPGEPHRAPMAASAAALRTASPAHAAGTRGVHRHCAHCSAHGCAHGTHAGAEDAGCA